MSSYKKTSFFYSLWLKLDTLGIYMSLFLVTRSFFSIISRIIFALLILRGYIDINFLDIDFNTTISHLNPLQAIYGPDYVYTDNTGARCYWRTGSSSVRGRLIIQIMDRFPIEVQSVILREVLNNSVITRRADGSRTITLIDTWLNSN